MRIAFTGSGGSGKTTTLQELNKTLKLPVITEGVRSYMKDNKIDKLRDLGVQGTVDLQNHLLDTKFKSEANMKSFISDRTSIDCATYALRWVSRYSEHNSWLYEYITKCIIHAQQNYDLIVIFPWNVLHCHFLFPY